MRVDGIRVVELFSGIGAQATALENLGIPFESVCCEIDDNAYEAYCAIHGDTPNLGDITKVEHLPPCDLLTYSYPCTSVSIAGKREGMAEGSGTASSLVWEVGRLLTDADKRDCLPEYLVMENVDAVLFKSNRAVFDKWVSFLSDLGYTSSYAVLNAKDYGLPQNRKRCFMVSSLHKGKFKFPPAIRPTKCLGDLLEDADESYDLLPAMVEGYKPKVRRKGQKNTLDSIVVVGDLCNPRRLEQHNRVYGTEGCSPALFTPHGCDKAPKIEDRLIRAGTLNKVYDQDSRVYSVDGIAPTVRIGGTPTPIEESRDPVRIRYLTPRECWRLQGFDDTRIDKAFDVIQNENARYKMAGNTIAVKCLEEIFRGMFLQDSFKAKQRSILEW
jgi:DNA (cytosine-5)-methyltransferase 1